MASSAHTEPLGMLTSSQWHSARVTRELLAVSSLQATRRSRTEPALFKAPALHRQAQQSYAKRSAQHRLHVLLSLLEKETKLGLASFIPPFALDRILYKAHRLQAGTGMSNFHQLQVSRLLKIR